MYTFIYAKNIVIERVINELLSFAKKAPASCAAGDTTYLRLAVDMNIFFGDTILE